MNNINQIQENKPVEANNDSAPVIDPVIDEAEIEKAIEQLAQLSRIQYDKIRNDAAKKLGLSLASLDSYVKEARTANNSKDESLFTEVEPWPEPVKPEELLSEIEETIRRFIVCEPETALAASLWVAMTWFMDEIKIAPIAIITAPEKRCGKSQLLSVLGKLSYRPLPSSNISPAALFRSVDKWQPTLLIDEADTFVRDNEELRGLLNAGHTRDSAYILRCVGDSHEPKQFNLWGAKALSGIGKLADTIMDRAIVLVLRRKRSDEKVERLRHAPDDLFETLQKKLARFADDYRETVSTARPDVPETLNDRAQDNWEPLLAIADTAGDDYGRSAREAAIKLSVINEDVNSEGVELLTNIHEIFEAKKVDRISSYELLTALCSDEEKRWASYNYRSPHEINAKQLSLILSEYNITSCNIRENSSVKKGYYRRDFEDAFQRYLPVSCMPPEITATSATEPSFGLKASTGAASDVAVH